MFTSVNKCAQGRKLGSLNWGISGVLLSLDIMKALTGYLGRCENVRSFEKREGLAGLGGGKGN